MNEHTAKYNCENTKLETDNYNAGLEQGYEEGFQDGAKFGYNKANEWHDLRKNPNELPNDGELVLANNLLYTESVKFGKDKGFGISWKTDYFELSGVVFWKEIVLPKECE